MNLTQPMLDTLLIITLGASLAAAQTTAEQRSMTDAAANAIIMGNIETQAARILKEAEELKQDGRYQEGADKHREILPLCENLTLATIIRATQSLDALLIKWEMAAWRSEAQNTPAVSAHQRDQEYQASVQNWQTELTATHRELDRAKSEKNEAQRKLVEFQKQQRQKQTMGASFEEAKMRKTISDLQTKIDALEDKRDRLQASKPRPGASKPTYSETTSAGSAISPRTLYHQLQQDFRIAIQEAKGRQSRPQ